MAKTIPNLWRSEQNAERLYQHYLSRLEMKGLHERLVDACRQIRRYAMKGPGPKRGLFTFPCEIDALCAMQNYQAAWRQLRRWERIGRGRSLDLTQRRLTRDDALLVEFYHAPMLFFLGRYRQGCALLESALRLRLRAIAMPSYDQVLLYVYNGDCEPLHRCRVTLSHFYVRLGRRLGEWRDWVAFVNGFHPKLFRRGGVGRDELLADSGKLVTFFDNLETLSNQRSFSGGTWGQADLIESEAKVRRRHEAMQRKLREFRSRVAPAQEQMETRLQELFPELRGHRPRRSLLRNP